MMKLARATVAACLLTIAGAWASGALEPFVLLHARMAAAEVVFAGMVVADQMVVPDKSSFAGAHRVVSVRPLFSLKGQLPQGVISIPHSSAIPLIDDATGRPYSWIWNHTREFFEAGGVYFIFANSENGSWVFRSATESNFRLDDPAGYTRREIETAAQSASQGLPADWRRKLDEGIEKAVHHEMSDFARPRPEADAIVLVNLKSVKNKVSRSKVASLTLPDNLHNEILLRPDDRDLRRIGANWHQIRAQGVVWAQEDLPVLGALSGAGEGMMPVHSLDLQGEIVEWIPLQPKAPIGKGRVTVEAALALDEKALSAVAPMFDPDGGGCFAFIPVCGPTDTARGALRSCGRPQIMTEKETAPALEAYRQFGETWREIALLDRVASGEVLPSESDLDAAGAVIGRRFARDESGWAALKETWLATRNEYRTRLERIALAAMVP